MLKKMLEYIFGENSKKSNQDVSSGTSYEAVNNDISQKLIISSIDELANNIENCNKNIEKSSIKVNYDYKLPDISILNDGLFKSFIEENRLKKDLMIPIGKDKETLYTESLQSMPNIIIGGTVMSGKSSFIHTIIGTILMCRKPYETKLIIFDSKNVEYSQYNGIPHLMAPIVTDCKKASVLIQKIVREIELRYDLFSEKGVKNISEFNNFAEKDNFVIVPDIILIIDDYDSFSVEKGINDSLEYITRNGWKANIYVIIASNHPSSQVISTISKSNIPARLCFKVPAVQDSIVILDESGANKLSGIGKALYKSRFISTAKCIKTEIIDENILQELINYSISQQKAMYDEKFMDLTDNVKYNKSTEVEADYDDPLYNDIVEFVITQGKASASLLQRRFKLGYNRAAKIVDLLEERGIIGPQIGSNPREVLVKLNNDDQYK